MSRRWLNSTPRGTNVAKVRYAGYSYVASIAADGGTVAETLDPLLRDILPDEPFKLLWLDGTILFRSAPADLCVLAFSKNIPPVIGLATDLAIKHGCIVRWRTIKVALAGVGEITSYQIVFPQPLDFDRDDSLLAGFEANNMHTTTVGLELAWTIGYTVG